MAIDWNGAKFLESEAIFELGFCYMHHGGKIKLVHFSMHNLKRKWHCHYPKVEITYCGEEFTISDGGRIWDEIIDEMRKVYSYPEDLFKLSYSEIKRKLEETVNEIS